MAGGGDGLGFLRVSIRCKERFIGGLGGASGSSLEKKGGHELTKLNKLKDQNPTYFLAFERPSSSSMKASPAPPDSFIPDSNLKTRFFCSSD